MTTVACAVNFSYLRLDWTGFYRIIEPVLLKIGPYQGGHGCLNIPIPRGFAALWFAEPSPRSRPV